VVDIQLQNWKGEILTVITVIISSGIVLGALNGLYNQFVKPNVNVDIAQNKLNPDIITIEVENNGGSSANKLVLKIDSPVRIINYTIFSSNNYTQYENAYLLQVYVPRFVNGEGSLIRIIMLFDGRSIPNFFHYVTVYATFDQGSVIKSTNEISRTWLEQLFDINSLSYYVIFIIGPLIVEIILLWFLRWRRKDLINRNINTIDILYNTFSDNEQACLYQLKQKRKQIYHLFLRNVIRSSGYEILDKKISEYESKILLELKKRDEGENQGEDSELPAGVS
jgi:hypothetical protein